MGTSEASPIDASGAESGAPMEAAPPPPPPATSCLTPGEGLTDCPGGNCCASLEVPGGPFFRSYVVRNGVEVGSPWGAATVSSFYLDEFEVTIGRFRAFIAAFQAGWRPAPGSGKHTHLNGGRGLEDSFQPGSYEAGWVASYDAYVALDDASLSTICSPNWPPLWTPTPSGNERFPMACMSWQAAYAFCIWDGGFLPSATEIEYAGIGGGEERIYPWGSTDPGTTFQYAIYDCRYPTGQPCTIPGNPTPAPVGTTVLGAGKWGHFDLVGNVGEWTRDIDTEVTGDVYHDCADLSFPSNDTLGAATNGTAFDTTTTDQLTASNHTYGGARDRHIGVRCARAP